MRFYEIPFENFLNLYIERAFVPSGSLMGSWLSCRGGFSDGAMSFYPKHDDRLARLEERLRRGTTVVLVLSKVRAFPAYNWSIHAQSTVIGQGNAPFPAAYSGTNSLFPGYQVRETFSVTGFLGYKPLKAPSSISIPSLSRVLVSA
jgi:hypothetical protein